MGRLACIEVPALALQTALKLRPEAVDRPLVLVPHDRPASRILNLNRAARLQGLKPGMRYSEALAVVCDLEAVVVSAPELEGSRQEILAELGRWSPRVEPSRLDPGAFWADPEGLGALFGDEQAWARGLGGALGARGFRAVTVVGSTRLGTYVLARSRRRSTVLPGPEAEAQAVRQAPLDVFPLPWKQKKLLSQLGVTTWGGLLALPAPELARRFGPDLVQEIRALEAREGLPVQGQPEVATVARGRRLEPPTADAAVLGAHLAELLADALAELGRRGRLAAELRLGLGLETGAWTADRLRPADPTASAVTLGRLMRLRLEGSPPPAPVAELRLSLVEVPLPRSSGDLFAPPVVRSLPQGAEALALLRARWGTQAVVRPRLAPSHRPEAGFAWDEVDGVVLPRPGVPAVPFATAVRRVFFDPGAAGAPPAGQRRAGPVLLRVLEGPEAVDREYWFLETPQGEVVWAGWDRTRRQTRWEGTVD